MEYDIKDIKKIRMQSGLTQAELAKKATVSQSLIAKIESGLLDPSYSHAKKIFNTLDSLKSEHEPIAKDIMQKQIITLEFNATIKNAIEKMQKNAISQIPVIKNDSVIGLITESDILEAVSHGKGGQNISEIMRDAPPIISKTTQIKAILGLLKFYSIIVVVDKGKIIGVITKADILNKIY
ncbi:MAG: CBS domain-containing protein [Candidatus Woesearchaeota archaeon]